MRTESRQIIIHLIHGTWANGWLKPKHAWFEDTSPLAKRLRDNFPTNVRLNSFYWSGKNSVRAREEAAIRLAIELEENANSSDEIDQIIIAHSHGGNLAYDAIKKVEKNSSSQSTVRGLICMGTPFVSLTSIPNERYWPHLVAIVGLIDSLLWTVILVYFPAIIFRTMLLMALVPFISLLTTRFLALVAPRRQKKIADAREVPIRVPTYLLRATRDEASLSLGLMQTFTWISSLFAYRNEIGYVSYQNPAKLVNFAIVYLCSIVGGFLTANWISKLLNVIPDQDGKLCLGLIYSFGFAGLIYLLGYATLAFSVGNFQVKDWLNTMIEVDAAPSGTFCKIKVYGSLNGFEGLRHGLYMSNEVVDDLLSILSEIMDEPPLSFINLPDADHKAKAQQGLL